MADFADISIRAVLEGGTLEQIPGVGMIVQMVRAAREIPQQLYLRKVQRFLQELSRTSRSERLAFLRGLGDESALRDFGEAILLLLERADDMRKPTIIGRIMAACIADKISYPQARRLCNIVDRLYLHDLDWLRTFKPGLQGDDQPIAEALHGAGVLSFAGIDGGTASSDGGVLYDLNEYSRLLLQCAFYPMDQAQNS